MSKFSGHQPTVARSAAPASVAAIERSLLMNVARAELILVRHGQQTYGDGPPTPVSAPVDPPLSPLGHEQARLVAEHLRQEPLAAVYCSHLERARWTAEAIGRAAFELEPVVIDELREIDLYGEFPGQRSVTEAIGEAEANAAAQAFLETRRFDVFPYTERSEEFRRRVTDAMRDLVRQQEGRSIVVVAHGGVINAFLANVLGIPIDMFFFPAHASVSRVFFADGEWALHTLNELTHLQRARAQLVTY